MSMPIQVTAISCKVDEITNKYAIKRVSRLYKYLPKQARKSASAEVKFEEVNHDHGNKYEVEIILNLPGKKITAKDSTVNMMAAVDIVEAKIQAQLHNYKSTTVAHIGNRGVMARLKRRTMRQFID